MQVSEIKILPDFLSYQLANRPNPTMLNRKENGKWISITAQQAAQEVDRAAKAMIAKGIKKGDKVCIISHNRPEWNYADIGALQIGAVVTPIYPTATPADFQYIINHSESRLAFVENEETYRKVESIKDQCPALEEIIVFDRVAGLTHYQDWLKAGENVAEAEVAAQRKTVQPQDLATMVYTSGTTGTPKGVMLSHHNMVSNLKTMYELDILPSSEKFNEARCLSFLPLCHVYERFAFYGYLLKFASVYYAESIEKIPENLKEVRPHFMTAVPRLLEKVFDKIMAKGAEAKGIRKKLFDWSIRLGLEYELEGKSPGYQLQLWLARKLVFSKWHEALGGNMEQIVTGGAALQPRLGRLFTAAGIRVVEGYGMSETSPLITANTLKPGGQKFGTVGRPLPTLDVKIIPEEGYPAGEGEIVCKGENVMLGYYKMPDVTAETIDPNGYLHTGDIGKFDADGFLIITDRKKEMFKTSGGSYIAPQEMENKIKESPFIEQVMVIGENRKFPAALIVPDFPYLTEWCKNNGVLFQDKAQAVNNPAVIAAFQTEIDKQNKNFVSYKQIKKFELLPDEWTPQTGELTPTMKLKRRVIMERYAKEVEGIYRE